MRITVNELREILSKHFREKVKVINSIDYADINNQYDIKRYEIGYGGVLDISFDFDNVHGELKCKIKQDKWGRMYMKKLLRAMNKGKK